MPYRDRERRNAVTRAWRQRVDTPAYNEWLYAKRKLHQEKAAMYEKTLRTISEMVTPEYMRAEAEEALLWADKREREVGNRFDHQANKPYYQFPLRKTEG